MRASHWSNCSTCETGSRVGATAITQHDVRRKCDAWDCLYDDGWSRSLTDFADLRALFINGTLKCSPELSHTGGLIDVSAAIMRKNGVTVDIVRAVDRDIATGV